VRQLLPRYGQGASRTWGLGNDSHSGHSRKDLLQKFQALAFDPVVDRASEAGEIAAGPGEAGDQAHRTRRHHDGDRRRGLPRGADGVARRRHDDVHLEAHQLSGQVGEALQTAFGRPALKYQVLALHIAEFAQIVNEGSGRPDRLAPARSGWAMDVQPREMRRDTPS
jgi:hypothetical protein